MKYLLEVIFGIISSFLFAIFGIVIGSFIGGNLGFPAFGGNVGYEAGGVFFAFLGVVFGSFLGVIKVKKFLKEEIKATRGVSVGVIIFLLMIIRFDYHLGTFMTMVYFFSPSLIFTLVLNLKK
jgi:hypothetical protein